MATISLFEKTLGADWNQLPVVLRRHYDINSKAQDRSCLQGKLDIYYPVFMMPVVKIIHLLGGLIDQRGSEISTRVEKWTSSDNSQLFWRRSLKYSGGRKVTFSSRMIYLKEHELIEYVNYGFGLRLKVAVQNGKLVYKSHGYIWEIASLRIIFPDWLLLGYATISEQALSDHSFQLNFEIRHPLWG